MFDSIKNKRVLVSGAAVGIGAEIARIFGEHGAYVGVHYNKNKTKAEKVANIISRTGKAKLFQCDFHDISSVEKLVPSFEEALGDIDILINNAGGIYDYEQYSTLSEMSWDKTYELNVKAPFFLMRAAFDRMKERSGGRIINISTTSVKYGGSEKNMHYSSSKAAFDSLTKGFSRAGAKHNILVNSIRCGLIQSDMKKNVAGYTEENYQKRKALIPLQRVGDPLDIARMALFLASSGGDYITGEAICVAGGD